MLTERHTIVAGLEGGTQFDFHDGDRIVPDRRISPHNDQYVTHSGGANSNIVCASQSSNQFANSTHVVFRPNTIGDLLPFGRDLKQSAGQTQ